MVGSDKVRIIDVAQLAGVSPGTVSNTINRPHTVAANTRKKVLAAIKKLDFVPNEGAAALRSGSSRLLGLVIPDVTNAFYAEITKGVVAAAADHGYAALLFDTDDDPDRELAQLEILSRHRSAGALVVPREADQHRLERVRKLGMPLVIIDRVTSEHDGCSVATDDMRGGLLAATHLLNSGRQRLAFVNASTRMPQADSRREGLMRALTLAGRDPERFSEIHLEHTSYVDGEQAAREILNLAERPDGVFCINDQLAIGLVRGLTQAGVSVPQDISVVGYGDSPIAESSPVSLTTIRQPMLELGRAAVEKLLAELEEPATEHRHSATIFTPSLTIRSSAP